MDIENSDADLTMQNWTNLSVLIQANPLQVAGSPTLFEALPQEFLPSIFSAHAAGCTAALGALCNQRSRCLQQH